MSEPNVSALHDTVLAGLGRGIVSGDLGAGQVITLDGVSADYRVSRSVAREAIRVLESLGMISSRRRIGITIQPSAQWNSLDARVIGWRLESGHRAGQLAALAELRRGYAPIAAALAAQRADPQQCRALAAAVSDVAVAARSDDVLVFRLADNVFHDAVIGACGNELIRGLHRLASVALIGHAAVPETATVEAYDEVVRAIRRRDAAAAERWMREIIDANGDGVAG